MLRLRPVVMLVAVLLPTMLPAMAWAADLDEPVHPPLAHPTRAHLPRGHLPARPPIIEPQVVERVVERVVVVHDRPLVAAVPVPVRVGGAFIFVPGLNGPDAAPVFPLLPFAFGYGY